MSKGHIKIQISLTDREYDVLLNFIEELNSLFISHQSGISHKEYFVGRCGYLMITEGEFNSLHRIGRKIDSQLIYGGECDRYYYKKRRCKR